MNKLINVLLILLFFVSCDNTENQGDIVSENDTFSESIFDDVAPINYSYIQSEDTAKNKNVLVVVIDPHGSGATALSHFNEFVNNHDCTIIGLNNVMNNQADFVERITENINTASQNLNLDVEYLFVVGFSGGARMAFAYSSVQNINGVLMCGAGAKAEDYYNMLFPVALIIGIRDFNFNEHYYSPYVNLASNMNILSLVFNGKHEWPPSEQINMAMEFLFAKNALIDSIFVDYEQVFNNYVEDEDYIFAYKTVEAAFKSLSSNEQLRAKQLFDNLRNSVDFKEYIIEFEQILHAETRLVGDYVKYLQPKDINWWTNEITEIKNLTTSSDEIVANSNYRLLGFMGIIMYSYTKNELKNPQSIFIDKYLKIYELLEPENPDLWFFKAVNTRNKGNSQLSNEYLQNAYSLGFFDENTAAEFGF